MFVGKQLLAGVRVQPIEDAVVGALEDHIASRHQAPAGPGQPHRHGLRSVLPNQLAADRLVGGERGGGRHVAAPPCFRVSVDVAPPRP